MCVCVCVIGWVTLLYSTALYCTVLYKMSMTKGKTLVTEGKTLVTEGKTLVKNELMI